MDSWWTILYRLKSSELEWLQGPVHSSLLLSFPFPILSLKAQNHLNRGDRQRTERIWPPGPWQWSKQNLNVLTLRLFSLQLILKTTLWTCKYRITTTLQVGPQQLLSKKRLNLHPFELNPSTSNPKYIFTNKMQNSSDCAIKEWEERKTKTMSRA